VHHLGPKDDENLCSSLTEAGSWPLPSSCAGAPRLTVRGMSGNMILELLVDQLRVRGQGKELDREDELGRVPNTA